MELLRIDAFEPDEDACEQARRQSPQNVRWHPLGLAGRTGEHDIYLLNRRSGSSLYPPNEPVIGRFNARSYWGIDKVAKIACTSLQDFFETAGSQPPHLAKLDTQGSELDILQGLGDRNWAHIIGIEAEVEFVEMYKGQPLFCDLHRDMTMRGFELMDLRTHRAYRATATEAKGVLRSVFGVQDGHRGFAAQLVAGDAIYFRKTDWAAGNTNAVDLGRYILLCLIYRYLDVAVCALDEARQAGLIDDDHHGELLRDIRRVAPRPGLANRSGIIARLIWKVVRKLGIPKGVRTAWTHRRWPDQ